LRVKKRNTGSGVPSGFRKRQRNAFDSSLHRDPEAVAGLEEICTAGNAVEVSACGVKGVAKLEEFPAADGAVGIGVAEEAVQVAEGTGVADAGDIGLPAAIVMSG
jgi:hypothetical protein